MDVGKFTVESWSLGMFTVVVDSGDVFCRVVIFYCMGWGFRRGLL